MVTNPWTFAVMYLKTQISILASTNYLLYIICRYRAKQIYSYFWIYASVAHVVTLSNCTPSLKLSFSPFYREGQEITPSYALSQVFIIIEDICKGHFPHVKFHCGPACPSDKCPGHQEDYISHPGVQRSHFWHHVFNVMPARKDHSTSSFYCVNQNFKEDLREWEP